LWVRAFVLGALVRVALWVLPFRYVYRRLSPPAGSFGESTPEGGAQPMAVQRAVKIIDGALSWIPRHDWLFRPLTTQLLLRRCGYPSELHIGLTKDWRDRIVAHAWVECSGECLVGHAIAHDDNPVSTWRSL
jgi:hypothetical protein